MHPQRRTYSKSFKAQVIHECSKPGACIANIALGYSLNANLATSGFGCTIKNVVSFSLRSFRCPSDARY